MKKLIFLLFFVVSTLVAIGTTRAQQFDAFKSRLEQPTPTSSVTLVEHGDASEVIRASVTSLKSRHSRFQGYRIGVFFDNGSEARGKAVAAKSSFEEHFKGIPVYLRYETPYFKVSAGNFATSEEAIILLERVREHFPDAYLMREEMTLADVLR